MNRLATSTLFRYAQLSKKGLSARKYMRSIAQTALLYTPNNVVKLNEKSHITDRVVQTFFDSSTHQIQVYQAANRLTNVSQFSSPAHSYYKVTLPFQSNLQLRKKMIQFSNDHIRTGRILQLMDYIAANVAYRYCSAQKDIDMNIQQLPYYTVTASIDQIDFFHPIDATIDCSFAGYVTYVGKSSMEVQIDVLQRIEAKQNERLACSAKFVMAARCKQNGKAYKVPRLDFQQQSTFKYKQQIGKKRQTIRKNQALKALKTTPPTYQQSSKVHNLMLQVGEPGYEWIPMKSTVQRNTLLMHLQDKNLSGKIFGGYILRLAYQLGWLTAFKFLKGNYPVCTHIDDVQFLGPVEIGTSVELQATVAFINEQILNVVVQCHNVKANGQNRPTNILRISFEYDEFCGQKTLQKIVYPETLIQSTKYIQSMRRVQKYLSE